MNQYTSEMIRVTVPLPNTPEMQEWCEELKTEILRDKDRRAEVRSYKRKKKLQVWATMPADYQKYGLNQFKKVVV